MPDPDIANLQGTWHIVALELDGVAHGPAFFGSSKIVIRDDLFATMSMGADYAGRFTVDTTVTPKQFDILFEDGPHNGLMSLGIYELEGDTWRICLGLAGMSRPSEFVTTPGSYHALETLRREAQASDDLTGDGSDRSNQSDSEHGMSGLRGAGDPDLQGEWAMVTLEMDGSAVPAAYVKTGKRVTLGDETTVTMSGQLLLKANYAVNRKTTPWSIDYQVTGGSSSNQTQLGIYEVNDETIRFCFAAPGVARPIDFTTKAGDGRILTSFKRG